MESQFTNALTEQQRREKEQQRLEILEHNKQKKIAALPKLMRQHAGAANMHFKKRHNIAFDDYATASSMDSIQNIVQTDIENIDTDIEELCRSGRELVIRKENFTHVKSIKCNFPRRMDNPFFYDAMNNVADNMNLVVKRYEDNFEMSQQAIAMQRLNDIPNMLKYDMGESCKKSADALKRSDRNAELTERTATTVALESDRKEGTQHHDGSTKNTRGTKVTKSTESAQSKDSKALQAAGTKLDCSDDLSPSIVNEEWLAFLRKTMREVLDGDFESLKQYTLVWSSTLRRVINAL